MFRGTRCSRFVQLRAAGTISAEKNENGLFVLGPIHSVEQSQYYGLECPDFRLSTLRHVGGKPWQLRTVNFGDKSYIAPFIIRSGVVESFTPIVSRQLMRKIGAMQSQVGLTERRSEASLVRLPSPLGDLYNFSSEEVPVGEAPEEGDVRYSLIGHGHAFFISDIAFSSRLVLDGCLTPEVAVDRLIAGCPDEKNLRDYVQNPRNKKRVRRELDAYMKALQEEREAKERLPLERLAEKWHVEFKAKE